MFGKENVRKTKATWESEHFVKATVSGEGVMKAVDAAGNDLAEYQVIKGRAAAGPFKAGDCFLFEVPAEKAVAGTYVSFDATLSAEPGAPMDWVVEWKDGDKWVAGKKNGGFSSVTDFYKNAGKGIKIVAKAAKADVSPIRDAFRMANIERPDILLFAEDGYHQSPYGSYLKSCVNYLILFGEPFGDDPADCGLDKKKTAALRRIAEDVVLQ